MWSLNVVSLVEEVFSEIHGHLADVYFVDVVVRLQNAREEHALASALQSLAIHHQVESCHCQCASQHSAFRIPQLLVIFHFLQPFLDEVSLDRTNNFQYCAMFFRQVLS